MPDYDTTATIHEMIRADRLSFDTRYQRAINPAHVARIARSFDARMVGVITVSMRDDGRLIVVDGQHRVEAARQAVGAACDLPCVIYADLTLAAEATLFADLQRNRRSLSPGEIFKADFLAGQIEAVAIAQAVERAGFVLNFGGIRAAGITCFSTLRSVYRSDRGVCLGRSLRLMQSAWGDEHAPRSRAIAGIARFVYEYPMSDDIRTADVLRSTTQVRIEQEGGALASALASRTEIGVARHIHGLYNKGLRRSRLAEWAAS